MKRENPTQRLVESALLIAAGAALEMISKLLGIGLPFGGTVTPASMFPIILISYRYGVKWGLLGSFTYSLIQILMGVKTVSAMFLPGEGKTALWKALCICFLDYVAAYTLLGFGGLFRGKFKRPATELALGSLLALTLRYLVHIVSGAIFYGAWAEWFFSQEGFYKFGGRILEAFSGPGLALVYSVVYNGLYMIPEIVITTIVAAVLGNVPQLTGARRLT